VPRALTWAATIKYLRCTTRPRPEHHDQVSATHSERRLGKRPEHRDQVPATVTGCPVQGPYKGNSHVPLLTGRSNSPGAVFFTLNKLALRGRSRTGFNLSAKLFVVMSCL
jgi:hypothetical protein